MKKGDLVLIIEDSRLADAAVFNIPEQAVNTPGVVISNLKEGQTRLVDPLSGKIYATELLHVVDVMISGKLYKQIPVRCLRKVEA